MFAGVLDPCVVYRAVTYVFSAASFFVPCPLREFTDAIHPPVSGQTLVVVTARVDLGSERINDIKGFAKPVRQIVQAKFAKAGLRFLNEILFTEIQEVPSYVV
jgi:hypothetical protein